MKGFLTYILIFLLVNPFVLFADTENLDERMARKTRIASATYTIAVLENSTTYVWQPETLCYTDIQTGKEVWILMYLPDRKVVYSKEYANNVWSFDGSIMGGFVPIADRESDNPAFVDSGVYKRWLVKTDGTLLKAATGYANEGIPEGGFGWAHTENAYYGIGAHSSWDADPGMLIKNVVDSNNDVTTSELLQLNTANTTKGWVSTLFGIVKRPISSDDNWISVSSRTAIDRGTTIDCLGYMRVALNKGVSPSVVDYWGINRDITEYYEHLKAEEVKTHGGGQWAWGFDQEYTFLQYSSSLLLYSDHMFFMMDVDGSATDGGPLWENWDGDSYGANEIMPTYGEESIDTDHPNSEETPGYINPYLNHPSFDMWEEYYVTGMGDNTGITSEILGPGISVRNVLTGVGYDGGTGEIANDLTTGGQYDGNHKSWNGWTDIINFFPPEVDDVAVQQTILYSRRLHFDTQTKDDAIDIVYTHFTSAEEYETNPRPSQSPDGTKVAFTATWLNNSLLDQYITYVVQEYPHPPEITQVTGTGTYTIRFDYRLDQTTARGYSNRGWPTSTDNKPVPREANKFRLWRSSNGTTEWVPISTITANITTKFDLSNGGLNAGQVGYWEISDTPEAGTWYYAVTLIENSGLESRALSNVFSAAGSQTAAYPASPGGDENIISTYNSDCHRYYNIHAADGSTPSISQTTRIASDPRTTKEFIDVFANADTDNTLYTVTALDTQGNESAALTVSIDRATADDGINTITWTDALLDSGTSTSTCSGTVQMGN